MSFAALFRRHRRPRRLVLIMAVRDEADILDANLGHHFSLGVDFALVADNGSTDGTTAILDRWRERGRLEWRTEADDGYRQAEWMSRLAADARDRHGADWILTCDADEFWCPARGDLKDFVATQRAPVLRCARRNEVRVRGAGDETAEAGERLFAPVLAPRRWREASEHRAAREWPDPAVPGVTWHGEAPKVLALASVVAGITQGSHRVIAKGRARSAEPAGIVIRHFPLRGEAQFARKVAAGGSAYARSGLPAAMGWHWRLWHAEAAAGRLPAAWRRETTALGTVPWPAVLGPARPARVAWTRRDGDGDAAGGRGLEFAVYVQAIRDDHCLHEVCARVLAEQRPGRETIGALFLFCPDEYWSGRVTPAEDRAAVAAVAARLQREWPAVDVRMVVQPVGPWRAGTTMRHEVESRVRNAARETIRASGYEHILVVDEDELWWRGALRRIAAKVRRKRPAAVWSLMVPVVGRPGFPVDGARDRAVVYIRATTGFAHGRWVDAPLTGIRGRWVIHFTAVKPTEAALVAKMNESGHYDDPGHRYADWVRVALPKIAPGFAGAGTIAKRQEWGAVRRWREAEWAEIPERLRTELAGEFEPETRWQRLLRRAGFLR